MAVKTEQQKQRTLTTAASFAGVGLFSGRPSRVVIHPAAPDTGLSFRRVDLPGKPTVAARAEFAVERSRRTMLKHGDASVEMVEHCLSALAGLGVDNALIDVDAEESPIGDGSAKPYVEAIEGAGVVEQEAPKRVFVIDEPVTVEDGEATIAVAPGAGAEYVYMLDYGEGGVIPRQSMSFRGGAEEFTRELAPARTFSTRAEAEEARRAGLFGHLTTKDMLVIDRGGPVENAYRFDDEPVRHKLLDLMGDLALVGMPIRGRVVAVRSGHSLNVRLARELSERAKAVPLAEPAMDIRAILDVLPHRFPMVMVDRVLELESGKRAVGIKNVTMNEPFFQGHYPGAPIMPGVMIVEAMSQLAGLMFKEQLHAEGRVGVLLSIDGVKLRRAVTPGDQLVMEAEGVRVTSRMGEADCRAFVGGQLVAEARVKFMIADASSEK